MSNTIKINVKLPKDDSYPELLRFYCQTCDADDPSLDFMSNMWSYANSKGTLTGKQARSADAYINHRLSQLNMKLPTGDESNENLSMEK